MMEVSAADILSCSAASFAAPDPLFFECLDTLLVKRISQDKPWMGANGLSPFQQSRASVGLLDFKCQPQTVRLSRDATDPLAHAAAAGVLILEYILAPAGGFLVPSPAAIPLLYPGARRVGEEACIDVAEPAKKCADQSGCAERPSGAEDAGASTGTGGDVVPPGTDPGTPFPGGDHL